MTRVGFFQDSVGGYLAQSKQTKGLGLWIGDYGTRVMHRGYRPFSVGVVDSLGEGFVRRTFLLTPQFQAEPCRWSR